MTCVKICGLKDADTVRAALQLPLDYIGFLFAPSKRQVTPELAGELVRLVQSSGERSARPLAVGVFVNPSREQLADVLAQAPLDVVQLHGDETPAFCEWVRTTFQVEVWRVFAAKSSDAHAAAEQLDPYAACIDAFLLDTAGGGTGKTFDWSRIPAYQQWADANGIPLFVAGGLQPDNVKQLLIHYAPDGVDVSSGVETDGKKDSMKMSLFVERVKRHESHASTG